MNMERLLKTFFLLSLLCSIIDLGAGTAVTVDANVLQRLIKIKGVECFDFRTNFARQLDGYIGDSILIPENLTVELIAQKPYNAVVQAIRPYEEHERIRSLVYICDDTENAVVRAEGIIEALGYKPDGQVAYVNGMNRWKEVGGEINFPREINYQALAASLKAKSILLIDVRNRTELNNPGQIPGSVCLPLHEVLGGAIESLSDKDFLNRFNFEKPQKDVKNIVLTCRSGRRILIAEKHMKEIGFKNLRIYRGSFRDWVKKGGKVIQGNFDPDYDLLDT